MKYNVKIRAVKTVNELGSYWTPSDYVALLGAFDYPDADPSKPEELSELLAMAITDFEPAEAAKKVLTYKLAGRMSEGKIDNVAYEMIKDRVAEEYPEPALHFDLFNINQLLYKAFNGTFPNTEATVMTVELSTQEDAPPPVDKEILTKALQGGLKADSLVKRLYEGQLSGEEAFDDAAKVIWTFRETSPGVFEVITSSYWIADADFEQLEFLTGVKWFVEG